MTRDLARRLTKIEDVTVARRQSAVQQQGSFAQALAEAETVLPIELWSWVLELPPPTREPYEKMTAQRMMDHIAKMIAGSYGWTVCTHYPEQIPYWSLRRSTPTSGIHYLLGYSHSEFGALPAPIQATILTEAKTRIDATLGELGLPLVSYGYSREDMHRLEPALRALNLPALLSQEVRKYQKENSGEPPPRLMKRTTMSTTEACRDEFIRWWIPHRFPPQPAVVAPTV
jgi:hypothetical protein